MGGDGRMTADAEQRVAPHAEQPERPFPDSSETARRLEGLRMAAESARGRIDADLIDEAQAVVVRSQTRLGLSGEHTIVALAGATGSGKSSLFNALCGLDLAAVGVKRPTTSWALACAWGPSGAVEILDWLGIPPRHQVSRMSLLDESAADRDLQGLVLLDLPDHDSTEVSHHLEVERLVELADVMVWVLDPQKYADAVIHDRYLRPLSSHRDVMLVVLNQVDQIPPGMVGACLTDVQRLLEIDGLGGVEVITTSATANGGVVGLRESLLAHVSEKRVARQRVEADIAAVAARLAEQTGDAEPPRISEEIHDRLVRACLNSADVPVLVSALEYARLIRARSSTAWPATAWLSRFRADPMSRLPAEDRAPAEAVPAEAVPAEAVPAEAVSAEAVPSEPRGHAALTSTKPP
ncbi:MAG: GTPase [Nocardioidaceae bacterium]